MFKKVDPSLDFLSREREVQAFWKENDIFKKSVALREGQPTYTFYDGPPTANGKPHIGHIITRAMKDLIPRYRTMKGFNVLRKAGWDTHGLPVELEVEKLLGLNGKEQIEAYGIEPFIEACKKSVWKYLGEWEVMSEQVAFWCDMDNPYITYHNDYIESVWWSLKKIHDKGLLYKGHKVVPYCPRCGTALSSHEVAQGYKSVTENSAFVRFPVKGSENTYIWAWTTTPWTLPSNVALCVNPDEAYAYFTHQGEVGIMAEARLRAVLGEEAAYEIVKTVQGKDLCGLVYEPLWDASPKQKAYFVVTDPYVTLTDGTGIVHTAPAFGEDDARVGRANGLPLVQLVDAKGCFVEGTNWTGTFVKDADSLILAELKERKLLFKAEPYTHDYPFCWRCDTPLLYYARESWFIEMTAVRERLMAANRSVNWLPENIKEGRMGNFIENVIDWGVSRERYWGTPLPIWLCECGHKHVIGSIEELKAMSMNCPPDIELHRPYIDAVTLTCPQCGAEMHRTKEVIDCWYDSGSMPFAQWHYPFENKEAFEARFPAQFISEAVDQTRGWFYTLLAISTLLFDRSPFETCLVLGHVQDVDGRKMSKHLGNVIAPSDVLDVQGADAVRWYFYTAGAPWLPSRFSADAVSEVQRKTMGTLWNTYAFFTLYASIDGFDPKAHPLSQCALSVMDKLLLSRLHRLIQTVDEGLTEIKVTESARAIAAFVDELSNWFVRRGRPRFWGKGESSDKFAAFATLFEVLLTLAKLIAPFMPFLAESMYQNLLWGLPEGAAESVHLSDFPVYNDALVNIPLEEELTQLIAVVQLGRAARSSAGIRTRQPLACLYVQGAKFSSALMDEARDELNVKKVAFVNDARAFTQVSMKPQMRTLGPKYGKMLVGIREWLAKADGNDCMELLASGEPLRFEVDGQPVELLREDILTETAPKAGFVSGGDGTIMVGLDTNLTVALIEEGNLRDIISKIQNMRKKAGFEVVDRIRSNMGVAVAKLVERLPGAQDRERIRAILDDPELTERGHLPEPAAPSIRFLDTIKRFGNQIKNAVLAHSLEEAEPPKDAYTETVEIPGGTVDISIWKEDE